MNRRILKAPEVVRELERLLASKHPNPREALDAVTEQLCRRRRYDWAGIYLKAGAQSVRQASSGPAAQTAEVISSLSAPVSIGARAMGMVVVESGRKNAFAREDQVLLKQAGKLIALYLSRHGKALLRHVREDGASSAPEKLQPESDRTISRPAAAQTRRAAGATVAGA